MQQTISNDHMLTAKVVIQYIVFYQTLSFSVPSKHVIVIPVSAMSLTTTIVIHALVFISIHKPRMSMTMSLVLPIVFTLITVILKQAQLPS